MPSASSVHPAVSPVLAHLPLFVDRHLPQGWQSESSAVVYRTVHDRFVIQVQSHPEAHWGASREAQLHARGVDGLDLDCNNFACDLVEHLREHLSLKEMQAVAAAFQAEIEKRTQEHSQVLELLDQIRGART